MQAAGEQPDAATEAAAGDDDAGDNGADDDNADPGEDTVEPAAITDEAQQHANDEPAGAAAAADHSAAEADNDADDETSKQQHAVQEDQATAADIDQPPNLAVAAVAGDDDGDAAPSGNDTGMTAADQDNADIEAEAHQQEAQEAGDNANASNVAQPQQGDASITAAKGATKQQQPPPEVGLHVNEPSPAGAADSAEGTHTPMAAEILVDYEEGPLDDADMDDAQETAAATAEPSSETAQNDGAVGVQERLEAADPAAAGDTHAAAAGSHGKAKRKHAPIPSFAPAAAMEKPVAAAGTAASEQDAAAADEPAGTSVQDPDQAAAAAAADGSKGSASDRKRKHAPIPNFQPRSSTGPKDSTTTAASKGAASEQAIDQVPPGSSKDDAAAGDKADAMAAAVAAAGPPPADATAALKIEKLVRPFTERALREKLAATGQVQGLWLAPIKTHCYVVFADVTQAYATLTALHGTEWPVGNKSKLQVRFVPVDVAQVAIDTKADPPSNAAATAPPRAQRNASLNSSGMTSHMQRTLHKAAEEGQAAAVGPGSRRGSAGPEPHTPLALDASRGTAGANVEDINMADAETGTAAGDAKTDSLDAKADDEAQQEPLGLDDLFRRTTAKPHLYYLPLLDEQVADKRKRKAEEQPEDAAGVGGAAKRQRGAGGMEVDGVSEPPGPAVQDGLANRHTNREWR